METTLGSLDSSLLDFSALSAGVLFVVLGVCLVLCLLTIISWWRIFSKANEGGWKSLIPILNFYTLFKICWSGKAFWATFFLGIFSGVCAGLASSLGDVSSIPAIVSTLLQIVGIILDIVLIVIDIKFSVKLAKAFGKGTFFGIVFVWIFETLGILILGLGGSHYIGKENI